MSYEDILSYNVLEKSSRKRSKNFIFLNSLTSSIVSKIFNPTSNKFASL